jgi:hypothetical protein
LLDKCTEKDFSFWMPIEVTKSDQGQMRIHGIASDETGEDLQGEKILVDGLDISYLLERGNFNWDHGKNPGDILGEIDDAKKQDGRLVVDGFLYPHVDKALEVYDLMRSLKDSKSKRRLGLSVEGKIKERDNLNNKLIRSASLKNVAITYNPINKSTFVDLVKSLGDFEFQPCSEECSKCSCGVSKSSLEEGLQTLNDTALAVENSPSQQDKQDGPALDKSIEEVPSSETRVEQVEITEIVKGCDGSGSQGLQAGYDIPATSGGVSGSALRKESIERKAKVTTYKKKQKKEGVFTKSELVDYLKETRNYTDKTAELMANLLFKAVQVKGYLRTRRGKLERVSPFSREMAHELKRLKTMSDSALITRAGKITHPEKALAFYAVAKKTGKEEVAGAILAQAKRLGLTKQDFESVKEGEFGGAVKDAEKEFKLEEKTKAEENKAKSHNDEYDDKIFTMPNFSLSEISCAYIGKPNTCMCGCSGKYYYVKENQKLSSKGRGSTVTDDEIDDGKVNRVLRKMKKNESSGIEVIDNKIFTSIPGNTQYTIYLNRA